MEDRLPLHYEDWLLLFREAKVRFSLYREMLEMQSAYACVYLRHDIDLLNVEYIQKCLSLEEKNEVKSTWFFLPPRDIRYEDKIGSLKNMIQMIDRAGHEIGYHVNAWEKPQTRMVSDDPLGQMEYDLNWYREVLGKPIRTAVAHGIPHHRDEVSNFSMYTALMQMNILQLDPFIIKDDGMASRIPHFGHRTLNPLLSKLPLFVYVSDSGGPIRKVWKDFQFLQMKGAVIVFNTHCANYDIGREFEYTTFPLNPGAIPSDCSIEVLM